MYINTLPLYTKSDPDMRITGWLEKLQQEQVNSREYQYTPLNEIQGLTSVSGDLFDTILIFENYPVGEVVGARPWSLKVKTVEVHEKINYPLGVIVGAGEIISIRFAYNTLLLTNECVKAIKGHFANVLQQVLTNAEIKTRDVDVLTQAERIQLLENFNETQAGYPTNKTIIELFEEQVALTPSATAVVFEAQQLTYAELDKRANQLAHYLRSKGVVEEMLVPVCIERSLEMIVGILGILKAGAAYVPIDPEYPAERINYMLSDTGAKLIAGSVALRNQLQQTGIEIVKLDGQYEEINNQPHHPVATTLKPANLAYVIYTSGSTGQPKGVMVEHGTLVASTFSRNNYYKDLESVILVPSISFDSSVAVIFGALTSNTKLVVCKNEHLKEAASVKKLLEKYNSILCVPSFYNFLLQQNLIAGSALKAVILAGESLNPKTVSDHFDNGKMISLYNEYGPTECTIWATVSKIEPGVSTIPIGKPIANTRIYILNPQGKPCPTGVTGELYIGGAGVARGYLNHPELTAERFLADPFVQGGRMYRTGDLGRWLPDGNIEYQGRIDDQVKIRGYRIELGEIESVLVQHEQVKQAVVLALETEHNDRRLAAYIVCGGSIDRGALQTYLHSHLPGYMVPAIIVELDQLPLTANGKVDKRSLSKLPVSDAAVSTYEPPRTELECQLAAIWQQLLGVQQIGLNDNFFELGGHSLLAMHVTAEIKKQTGFNLTIRMLYQLKTIQLIAGHIEINNPSDLNADAEYENIFL
jgi:amino acid adenylation domain-containing protein